jgi:AraC family transcriptional regulator
MSGMEEANLTWRGARFVPPVTLPAGVAPQAREQMLPPEERGAAEGEASPWSRTAPGGLPAWRLKRVLAYIDDNLGGDINLDDLAGVARLSPHHFSELFRQSTGTSPYRYVLRRRVECAKVLLRESVMGVLEVALAVGFADQSHFSKVFRRVTGMAPGAWRAAAA